MPGPDLCGSKTASNLAPFNVLQAFVQTTGEKETWKRKHNKNAKRGKIQHHTTKQEQIELFHRTYQPHHKFKRKVLYNQIFFTVPQYGTYHAMQTRE
jgi:hypothetical protein